MSSAVNNLISAQQHGMKIRPKVGGFPYFAEALRAAGVIRNRWTLPSCQSLFLTKEGPVVIQGTPLITGSAEVPVFNKDALIKALRKDQAGEGTFPEFLQSAWKAGVIGYEVDFEKREVIYLGCLGEQYIEEYPLVKI